MNNAISRGGYVAILGRPNVGKSTLINALVGQKVSIICHKQQTTRHRIHGIKTYDNTQIIYVDTPGIHLKAKRAMNRYMNQAARATINDVDVILFVVSAKEWTEQDELVLEWLERAKRPVILVVNKIDQVKDKTTLLPFLQRVSEKLDFAAVVPVSALQQNNLQDLEETITGYLPEGPHFFADDQVTDSRDNFLVAEVIREKLFQQVHEEIPYSATVVVDQIKSENSLTKIAATIYVEKDSQKAIVIGRQGSKLKQIGKLARLELERTYGNKVFLQLWVKVKEDWANSEQMLKRLGFD